MLKHKRILIGVTGGIAAYKIPFLVRLLIKEGAELRIMLTPAAHRFVSAEVLSVLSNNQVVSEFYTAEGLWNNHVAWAEWADIIVIAPATLNTLSALASGSCTRFLDAVYFSSKCPVMLCPAMDLEMYQSAALKDVLIQLRKRKRLEIIEPETGFLASGLQGQGRLPEPETLVEHLKTTLASFLPLTGKQILISAGPTHEYIDAVRFLGNQSSGQMGICLAEAFAQLGAQVELVLGPTVLKPEHPLINCTRVTSAQEMLEQMQMRMDSTDMVIAAAAVADYRPKTKSTQKLKKTSHLIVEFEANPDLLVELSRLKKNQIIIGFALETDRLFENALAKLKHKKLDYILANWASESMGKDTTRLWLIDAHNTPIEFPLNTKHQIAHQIAHHFCALLK